MPPSTARTASGRSHTHAGSPRGLDHVAAQLAAAGRGDPSAFADLYANVAPGIYGLVLRILKDVQQSEEVTQEVFLDLWRTCNRFDPNRGSGRSWVMTMAHHKAVDRVRSTDASRRRDAADAERGHRPPFDQTAATAHASLEAETVRAAVATLSPCQRQALELAYFGGYTYNEVSQLLNVPLGTAKSRIRDGLLRLRATLTPEATASAAPTHSAPTAQDMSRCG